MVGKRPPPPRRGWVGATATKSGRTVLPDRPGLMSETGRCAQGTGVVKPRDRRPAQTRWIWAGAGCETAPRAVSQTTRSGRGTVGTVNVSGPLRRSEWWSAAVPVADHHSWRGAQPTRMNVGLGL